MKKPIIAIIISAFVLNSYGLLPAPQTIYVGSGFFAAPGTPCYFFYSDSAGNVSIDLDNYEFYHGFTYTFIKIAGYSHPFYLSDIPDIDGSYHYGTLSTNIVVTAPNASRTSGITPAANQNSLTFTMNPNYTNMLHYYCTKSGHVGMVNSLNICASSI